MVAAGYNSLRAGRAALAEREQACSDCCMHGRCCWYHHRRLDESEVVEVLEVMGSDGGAYNSCIGSAGSIRCGGHSALLQVQANHMCCAAAAARAPPAHCCGACSPLAASTCHATRLIESERGGGLSVACASSSASRCHSSTCCVSLRHSAFEGACTLHRVPSWGHGEEGP